MTGSKKEAKSKMSDEERSELMKKMDQDLAEHFAQLEAKAKERGPRTQMVDGFTEENWEDEMANHPFFKKQFEDGEELSPLMQGLQDLKYSPDDNTPEELAKNYKEDGNFNFKCKKYRFAVASYTEGLKAKCSDSELNAQLLTNRAAAQFHIGNLRSSLLDCQAAIKILPGHMKAIVRGAQCQFQLKHFAACKEWCDLGLETDRQHSDLLKMRQDSVNQEKAVERDRRKRQMEEKRKKVAENVLLDLIKQRGIKVSNTGSDSGLDLSDLEPCHPAAMHKKVHVEENILVWPVLFLYPEVGETDFIEEFRETDRFSDHLEVMFGAGVERPPWDTQTRYTPSSIVIYFEDCDTNIVEVSLDMTLCQALTHRKFLLKAGTPGFILLVRDSKVHQDFLSKYTLVN